MVDVKKMATKVYENLPIKFRDTALLQAFGMFKIPLLFFCSPKVLQLDNNKCVIKIPLNFRTKNHLGSMYFGVLACGADCAGGLSAMKQILLSGHPINLVFKDFKGSFHKRPHEDVYFTCEQGEEINQLIKKVIDSKERQNMTVKITATAPKQFPSEPVAEFELTLSLKLKEGPKGA